MNRVTCPWHGSVFNITTGEVVEPPARRPMATFRVQVEGGEVLVELPGLPGDASAGSAV